MNRVIKLSTISAATAAAAAAAALITPAPAAAFDVSFSFDGVTGLITNLVPNTRFQKCDAPGGCVVTVDTPTASSFQYQTDAPTSGFDTGSDNITEASWNGTVSGVTDGTALRFFGFATSSFNGFYAVGSNVIFGPVSFGPVTTPPTPGPSSSVPGPLPVLGAAAAFGCSRRLRNRISTSKSSGSTALL